ncbi:hypothetical protein Tco_1426354, partial [Tanacetum coccineum]
SDSTLGRTTKSSPFIGAAQPGITCIAVDKSVENAFSFTPGAEKELQSKSSTDTLPNTKNKKCSLKGSSREYVVPHEFIRQQRAYYKEIDEYEPEVFVFLLDDSIMKHETTHETSSPKPHQNYDQSARPKVARSDSSIWDDGGYIAFVAAKEE